MRKKRHSWPVVHGLSDTPLHYIYRAAKQRCNNPKHKHWKDYGGRGIKFLFSSFLQFLAEVGPRPKGKHSSGYPLYTLDREDNNGNYEPGNMRWVLRTKQNKNRRKRTHCKFGHEYAVTGFHLYRNGTVRVCKVCKKRNDKTYSQRSRQNASITKRGKTSKKTH
jgi:hypothetical protein